MFDILQWNCKGLRARTEDLKVLMHESNPGIICLQETMLGNSPYNPGLNYSIFNSHPPIGDRAHGGAAIIVNKSLQHSAIQLNTTLQAVAVSIILEKRITICSLYLPPDLVFNIGDIQSLINQLPTPLLLLGDFNAHNPLWGSLSLDSKGKLIEDFIDRNDVSLYNDGSMTFHNVHDNHFSALDLSISSTSIHLDFNWSVNEDLNGSDHYPIHLKYALNAPSEVLPKWKVEDADWDKFSKGVNLDREFESFNSHLDAYEYFIESTLKSAEESIPKTKGKPHRPAVPWWNKTCGILRKVTRKCYRRYKTSGSPQSKLIYKRALAKQRRFYKKAKRECWLYYINGINSKTPLRVVWRKIRKLSGKFVASPLPSLKINNTLISKPTEVANELGKHFSKVSSPNNYSPEFQRIRNSEITLKFDSGKSEPYNYKFSIRELREALSSSKSTAPGEDTIIYEMLKHLPDDAKKYLLKIINKIWETGILPKEWKISIIIPIKKPNKDASQATSYRPIALTSCVCKLMEKMINTRLVWHLETKGLISPFQFGFRKNCSTLDPLLRLTNQIQQGFAKKCQTIGVFFDLEKAYDTTWRTGIMKQLHKMGMCGRMVRFIHSFLTDRFFKVRVGNSLSQPFVQEEGVPQGSVLSVTLFSVAINSVLGKILPPVKCSLFVDDLSIYCTGYDSLSVCKYLQKSINAITKWADENGFKFSSSKTIAVRFTRCRRVEEVPTLSLKGSIIPYEKEVKFLGMTIDHKLTWASHINTLKINVKQSLNILKVVSGFGWGADKKSLLRLYDSLCRSKLDYGCQIYSSACKTTLKELDVVHNMGLRICSGAFRTSPVESIYVDTDHLPLDLRRQELGLRYVARMKSAPKNPSFQLLKETDSRIFSGTRASKPFQIRLNEDVRNNHLKSQKVLEVHHPVNPPWLIPEPLVCEKSFNKKDCTEEEIRGKFLEHDLTHANYTKVYTDGSKSDSGVGCAIIFGDTAYTAKLPDSASIFTAELTAVVSALGLVFQSSDTNFVIYSDSKSTLEAIKIFNSFHPLIQKAQEWLFRIHCVRKSVSFCWVPSHVGIHGNEMADKEAKAASTLSETTFRKVPHTDLKGPIRSYILSKWQEKWNCPLLANNIKYRNIRNSILPWPSSFQLDRRTEVILARLRIGHTHLTHQFILEGSSPPECAYCDEILTVEHILMVCPRYSNQRGRYFQGKSLSDILGDEADVSAIVSFLKCIQIFNNI